MEGGEGERIGEGERGEEEEDEGKLKRKHFCAKRDFVEKII